MNLKTLHEIPSYQQLFTDPRFVALIQYLRANPGPKSNSGIGDATAIIRSEGAWHGWFECIEKALATGNVKPPEVSTPKSPAYSQPSTVSKPQPAKS